MPAKKKRGKGSRSPSPNANAPKKAKPSEGEGSSSNVKTEEDTPMTGSGLDIPVAEETAEDTPKTGSEEELPASGVPAITNTPATPLNDTFQIKAEEQEEIGGESLKVPSNPTQAGISSSGEGPGLQEEFASPSSSTASGPPVILDPEDPYGLYGEETGDAPDPTVQVIVSPTPSPSNDVKMEDPSTPPPAAATPSGEKPSAQELLSPSSSTASGPAVILNSSSQNTLNPRTLLSPSPSTSPSASDPPKTDQEVIAKCFKAWGITESGSSGSSPSENSSPRFANGKLLNSPEAKVPGLFSGPVAALQGPGNYTSCSNQPPKSPPQASGSTTVVPPVTPEPKEPPTPQTTGRNTGGIFSTPATQTTNTSQATTPSDTPLPPPPFKLQLPLPGTTPAASSAGRGSGSITPPPGKSHIYFYNDDDHKESAREYPAITDPADRAATMGMHVEDDGPLRSYVSPTLPPPPQQEGGAGPYGTNSGFKSVGTTRPKEIDEFQQYAEGKEGDECVALGTKALDAALKMGRNRMVEHLTLVNANRELSELSNRLTEQLKSAMKEAKKRRGEGTITQHEFESAMQDERDAAERERNAKEVIEAEVYGLANEIQRLEEVEREYEDAQPEMQRLQSENCNFKREVAKLKRDAEEKDEEIRKLKEQKKDIISKDDCNKLNAIKVQELQDKIAGLEKALTDATPPQNLQNEINAAFQRFSDWISSLDTPSKRAGRSRSSSGLVLNTEEEVRFVNLLKKLHVLIAELKTAVELNAELQDLADDIAALESELRSDADVNSETGSQFSAGQFMEKENELKALKDTLRVLDLATPTGMRLEAELQTQLEYIKLLESGAPTGFDAGDEKIFKECNEDCIAEKEKLLNDIQKLFDQMNDADEALRRCRAKNPSGLQETGSPLLLREMIKEMCAQLEKAVADNEAMSELFRKYEIHKQGATNYNELEAECRDLKRQIKDLDNQLLSVGLVNSQLNDDIEKLQAKLKKQPDSQGAAPQVPQLQQAAPSALEKEIEALKASQTTLRETNQLLRHEVEPLKRKLRSVETERTMLKNSLRLTDAEIEKLEKKIEDLSGELDKHGKDSKDQSEGKAAESKEIKILEEKVQELENELDACKKSAEAESDGSEAGRAALEQTIQDLEKTIEENERKSADARGSLEAKILKHSLDEAKAERQIQIEKKAEKNARQNKEPDANTPPDSNKAHESDKESESDKASSSGAREEVAVSSNAMEVVFLRCELQLGQLQAGRSRWGFRGDDAVNAISVAIEAMAMAERLNDSNLLGRANYWRGVAEFMAGNSGAAEQWFEESASQPWTETEDEKELLQEWWDVSKTATVDKTVQFNPLEESPQLPRSPPRTVPTKPKRSAEEKEAERQAKREKKQAKEDRKQARKAKKQARKDKKAKKAADLRKKKGKGKATETQPPAEIAAVPVVEQVQPAQPQQPKDAAPMESEPEEVTGWYGSKSCTSQ